MTKFLAQKDWMGSPRSKPKESPKLAARGPRRATLPVLKPAVIKRGKDKLKSALAAASELKARGLRRPSIEDKFVAESAKDSKNAKKRTVALILEALAGLNGGIPLTVELLKGLASALQEGGYSAGEGYLVEAKLWHVEEGHQWSDQLDRTFKQCKRALTRGQGPRKRAAEVPKAQRDTPARLSFTQANKAVKFGAEIFRFCVIWMLRELELANLNTDDILLDYICKKVTLNIRVSKMDPSAKGVRRTLQCLCSGDACLQECPFRASAELLSKVEKFNGTNSGLALLKNKTPATKAQIIKTWQWLFGAEVTGHSGRRTGALNYMRSGWAVGQVAHLGRWKSNAILSYAEEALERLPANMSTWVNSLNNAGAQVVEEKRLNLEELEGWKNNLRKEINEFKKAALSKDKEKVEALETWIKLCKDNPTSLPSRVQSWPSKVIHWNLAKAAASPPVSWRTACGWAFYGSNFVFTGAEVEVTCQKCKTLCARSQ